MCGKLGRASSLKRLPNKRIVDFDAKGKHIVDFSKDFIAEISQLLQKSCHFPHSK